MIHKVINLWEGLEYRGVCNGDNYPKMTTYIRADNKKRGIVLVMPGGGYEYTSPREAEAVSLEFNKAGYHAVVLDYSVAPNRHPLPLLDAARALSIILENADKWHVKKDSIFVCGFSAGGHLAASISTCLKSKVLYDVLGIDLQDLEIKGTILAYPVITSGKYSHKGSFDRLFGEKATKKQTEKMSVEHLVDDKTPPAFVWHTFEDTCVPLENSLLYVNSLRKYNIPFELHIFPKGGHGISLATKETARTADEINSHVANWMGLCIEWMNEL